MKESAVFHRRIDRLLPKAVKAEGVWIYDETGKKYLDASGGPICVNVGHGRQEVADAIYEQAKKLAYVHGPMFTSDPIENLAERLTVHFPEGINRVYFCSSGCEAIETAIKLSRQIQVACGQTGRYRVITRWQSYHGSTLGALSVTGKPSMRGPFLPLLSHSIHIPPPYCLRCHFGLSYPGCGIRCATVLEEAICNEGQNSISAFLAETVLGSTIGAVVPPAEYYEIIREICNRYGILLILDEIMCGVGRTGKWLGLDHYSVSPDMVVLGKGLNGGYAPISAVGCRRDHVEIIREKTGNFIHGHTFSHHAVAASAALSVIRIIENENLVERAQRMGNYLEKRLELLSDHPNVAQIRGIGLMWAVEVVRDKKNLEPFSSKEKITEKIAACLMDMGVIVYQCTGFTKGRGDAIMLGPPFIISEKETDMAVEAIYQALNKTLENI